MLHTGSKIADEKSGVLQIFDRLGYIQIDTISVINRAHHHILWSRQADYSETVLHELQAIDRAIFEYWGHAMSYLPIADYRYFLPRMRNFREPQTKWGKYQIEQAGHLLEPVLERIKNEGPLSSKDFAAPPDKKNGTWWDWKPAKIALELLFWRGDLMVTKRRKFQKLYDLTERVLPDGLDLSFPEPVEIARFLVMRALKALGIASESEIQRFMQPDSGRDADLRVVDRNVITKTIQDLVNAGEIFQVKIEENPDVAYFVLPENTEHLNQISPKNDMVFFLSPFDNLIIQRDRLKRIFNFDYALECYVPEVKRKFGYFVLPILYGQKIVGRFDPKADRKNKTMIINRLIFEDNFTPDDQFLVKFVQRLIQFSKFNSCKNTKLNDTTDKKLKTKLTKLIDTRN